MAEMLHPDIYIKEIGGVPILLGVGTGTGCFIGEAPSGPVNSASLVTNYGQFESRYGSDGGNLDVSVKLFFDNGGTRCYIIRVVPDSGTANADASLKNMDITALYVGSYANGMSASTTRYTVALASGQSITSSSDNVDLTDASEVEIGDIIYFWDSSAIVSITVSYIDGDTIYFETPTVAGTIDDTTTQTYPGVCPTVHKLSTKTDGSLNASTAYQTITLNSVGALEVGDAVVITYYDSGSGNSEEFVRTVDSINGKQITLDSSVTLANAASPFVVSLEFNLTLSQNGSVIDTIDSLSASGDSPSFYETIVNAEDGSQNVSNDVQLSYTGGGTSAGDDIPYLNVAPYDGSAVVLSGGNDGSGSIDYIGSTTYPRSGIGILDEIKDVQMLSIPGITSESEIQAGKTFCENRGTCSFIYSTPDPETSSAYNEPNEVKQWRMQEVNIDSSYALLYYPWVLVDDGSGGNEVVPPDGAIQGAWANVTAEGNPATPPANIALANVNGVSYNVTDSEQDILNPIGINCIREFPGRGIRIWGVRTLTSVKDGRHYANVRGLLNFIKHTIYEGTRWAVFQSNDEVLWTDLRETVSSFLHGLWLDGALVPSNNESRAWYVKCDEETNPIEKRQQGIVSVEVGVNPPFPSEFVVFNIGVWDGGGSIGERTL